MNDNLYICPQYLKCKQKICCHATLHKPISIKIRGFDHNCYLSVTRGICDYDPEQKVIKCIQSDADTIATYEKKFLKEK